MPILSGLLIGFSYIPFPPWALLFCLVPICLFIFRSAQTWKECFQASWITQAVFTGIGFFWLAPAVHEFGYVSWPVAFFALIVYCAVVHLYYPLAAVVAWQLRRLLRLGDFSSLMTFACCLSLGEMFWPSLFPWNLGYAWMKTDLALIQWADLIGFLGLSFVTIVTNCLLAYFLLRRNKKLFGAAVLMLALLLFLLHQSGEQRSKDWETTDATLNVLQIQANVGNAEKLFVQKGLGFADEIANRYIDMTREAQKDRPVDLIVWPESAYPVGLSATERNSNLAQKLFQFLREIQKPLLVGAFSQVGSQDFNSVFLLGPSGQEIAPAYHKSLLLAYGERSPFADSLPFFKDWSPAAEGLTPGSGPRVMQLSEAPLGIQICYEGLDPNFSRQLSKLGAAVIVNLTNDSWFGPTNENEQHLLMTLARALETRRPLIRNANTGLSTAILASGKRLSISEQMKPWSALHEISYLKNPPQTFYSQYGQWLAVFVAGLLLLCLCFGRIQKPSSAVHRFDS